jgi:pyrroline-5-carboxylate reductase
MTEQRAVLSIVGGGNMGSALLEGLIAGGLVPTDIVVVEVDAEKRAVLSARFGVRTSESIVPCDGAVIAVKPQVATTVCAELAVQGAVRIVSIAAGVTVRQLQEAAGSSVAVIRAMPNTPALVGQGATSICAADGIDAADVEWARRTLGAVGLVVHITEDQMDVATAVAGSGPGYLFLFAEALLDASLEQGLPRDVAEPLIRQLFKGSGELLASSPDDAATLKDKVTSPNGVTFAGLQVFESEGFRDTVRAVVRRAAERNREMGQ